MSDDAVPFKAQLVDKPTGATALLDRREDGALLVNGEVVLVLGREDDVTTARTDAARDYRLRSEDVRRALRKKVWT